MFLSFLFLCSWKTLAVSPQRMTCLVKIMQTIVEKSFFTLVIVSACLKMLEWSYGIRLSHVFEIPSISKYQGF